MHIAINGWFWDQPHVGSGQYIRRLVENLRHIAPDLNMTLVLPPHNNEPDHIPENVNLITTSGPGGRLGKIWFEQRTFPAMVRRCNADIAHVPYWGPPLTSPARLVTSVLDVIPLVIPDYSLGFANRVYTALARSAAVGSAHVITLSETAAADITTHLGISPEKISPIYPGVDSRYHPRIGAEHDEAIRAKYGLPDEYVLYLGGFDLRKQVNQLLLAYTYVGEAEGEYKPLVLAGKQPRWGSSVFPDLPAYIKELGLQDYVIWPGYIEEDDKPALYRMADVFVYPSMYEGFGLPLLEAMACGTPVVANEIDVFSEIVGDGAFLTHNARNMAGAIIALINQEPLRQSMVNQGLAQATRYSWRKTARETLDVYERVMAA
jgi:glycosyltransferase involved in cell wall biosynthesis